MRMGWTEVQAGVQLWQPEVEATEDSMSSLSLQEGSVQGTESSTPKLVLKSIEEETKVEQNEDLGDLEDFRDTWSATSSTAVATPATSASSSFPSSVNIFDQLQDFVDHNEECHDHEGTAYWGDGPALGVDSDNESTRTDFLLDRESPSIRRVERTPRQPRRGRPHVHEPRRHIDDTVFRRLDFGASRTTRRKVKKAPEKRGLEYSPRHLWTTNEREFLCVLYRWFVRDTRDFAAIFNKTFDLDLPFSTVCNQFENHVRLMGEESFPIYGEVFSTPFNNPHSKYAQIRRTIEMTAKELGIELENLSEENLSPSGKAKFAKSPRTRRTRKDLARRAKQREVENKQGTTTPDSAPMPVRLLGGFSMTIQDSDAASHWSDVEDNSPTLTDGSPTMSESLPNSSPRVVNNTPFPPAHQAITPQLAYRVWDSKSRAIFDATSGFTSEAHSLWNGPLLPPFSFEGEGQRANMLLLNQHLSMESKTPSYFISVTTSLLQAISKASTMVEPSLAIIDLQHPFLEEPNKKLHIEPWLKWLKHNGQALWARYKGSAEWVIWARIDAACVLYTFPLEKLVSLSRANPVCDSILNLDLFEPGLRVRDVAPFLRKKGATLCPSTSKALGQILRTCGMGGRNISIEHIACLVARLCDGFYVTLAPDMDLNTRSTMASAFALALNSEAHHLQAIMGAFLDGVLQGMQDIEFYSRRGRCKRT